MSRLSPILTLFVLISIRASNVHSAVVYSQIGPGEPVRAFGSDGKTGAQKIADNFSLTGDSPVTIRSLRFIGGYGRNDPPPRTPPLEELPDDLFRIVFYEDSSGSPGLPVDGGSFSIENALSRSATRGPLLATLITPLEYVVDLGVGVVLHTRTDYWISITNDPGPEYSWVWANPNGSSPPLASTNGDVETGAWQIDMAGSMWLELRNVNVPEPDSIALCVLSSAIFLMRRVAL